MRRAGHTIQMAHTSAVVKNDVVIKDGFAMVALNTAEENELIAYGISGTFDFKGGDSHTLKVGDKAFYKESDKTVSQTTTDVFIGRVVMLDSDKVEVKINTGV